MHEGHRRRLLQKLKNCDNLYEHELLEILLFNAYPRKNVNPVAHALLARFPSIRAVVSAEVSELCAVEGVGENVALYLKCIGECLKSANDCSCFAVIKNTQEFKQFIAPRFRGKNKELLEIYLLDKTGRIVNVGSFTNDSAYSVTVSTEEILKLITSYRPYGIFVAHNHIDGCSFPSASDDKLTKQIQLICSLNNTRFYDHCVYASDSDIYSYFLSNRIENIKERFSVTSIIENEK